MKERCEQCLKEKYCQRIEKTKEFRQLLDEMEIKQRNISGSIIFHCDYFQSK